MFCSVSWIYLTYYFRNFNLKKEDPEHTTAEMEPSICLSVSVCLSVCLCISCVLFCMLVNSIAVYSQGGKGLIEKVDVRHQKSL